MALLFNGFQADIPINIQPPSDTDEDMKDELEEAAPIMVNEWIRAL